MDEEDRRLDLMMEQKRQRELKAEENKRKKQEEKNARYIMIMLSDLYFCGYCCRYVEEVTYQIRENDIARLIKQEQREEEAKLVNKALIAIQREELELQTKKKEKQIKLREELKRANDEALHFRKIAREEQRIADLKVGYLYTMSTIK